MQRRRKRTLAMKTEGPGLEARRAGVPGVRMIFSFFPILSSTCQHGFCFFRDFDDFPS